MSKFERPQRRNPHELTLQQHVLPRKTIARFCGADGRVKVRLLAQARELALKPIDPLFCVQRAWDQRGESVVGGSVEGPFQAIAARLADGSLRRLDADMHAPITEMYLLWRHRCIRVNAPVPDFRPRGVTPCDLSTDEQERLEKAGVSFVRPDGTIAGRVIAGHRLQHGIDGDWLAGANAKRWGILRCPEGLELLVPDAFIHQPVLPVAPHLCLASGVQDAELTEAQVTQLNQHARMAATRYWFARDPSRCPPWRESCTG